jgi:hypothetical protein
MSPGWSLGATTASRSSRTEIGEISAGMGVSHGVSMHTCDEETCGGKKYAYVFMDRWADTLALLSRSR